MSSRDLSQTVGSGDELRSQLEAQSMVERVARAMAVADGCDPDEPAYVRYPGGHAFGVCWRDKYATKARAAIEAMREPTEAMERAGDRKLEWAKYEADDIFRAMIDAALKDTP